MTLETSLISGEVHPIFILFMGGSDLNDKYDLKKSSKLTTQLRTMKQSILSKRFLIDMRVDLYKLNDNEN